MPLILTKNSQKTGSKPTLRYSNSAIIGGNQTLLIIRKHHYTVFIYSTFQV